MGVRVTADLPPGGDQLVELAATDQGELRHGAGRRVPPVVAAQLGRDGEDRGSEAQPVQEWQGVAVDALVRVVEGEGHRSRRERGAATQVRDDVVELEEAAARFGEPGDLALEDGSRQAHRTRSVVADGVVGEDGDTRPGHG